MSLSDQIPEQYAGPMDATFETSDDRRFTVARPGCHSYAMVGWEGRMMPLFKFEIHESVHPKHSAHPRLSFRTEVYSPNYREDALTDVLVAYLNTDQPMSVGVSRVVT